MSTVLEASEVSFGIGDSAGDVHPPTAGVIVNGSQRHISDINWEAILSDVRRSSYPQPRFSFTLTNTSPRCPH